MSLFQIEIMINFYCISLNCFYLKSFVFYRHFSLVVTVRQKIFYLATVKLCMSCYREQQEESTELKDRDEIPLLMRGKKYF